MTSSATAHSKMPPPAMMPNSAMPVKLVEIHQVYEDHALLQRIHRRERLPGLDSFVKRVLADLG